MLSWNTNRQKKIHLHALTCDCAETLSVHSCHLSVLLQFKGIISLGIWKGSV